MIDLLDDYQIPGGPIAQVKQDENPLFRQNSTQTLKKRTTMPIQIPSQGQQAQTDSSLRSQKIEDDTELTISRAIDTFQMSLGLEDNSVLRDIVHLREVPAGAYLAKEDSQQVRFI